MKKGISILLASIMPMFSLISCDQGSHSSTSADFSKNQTEDVKQSEAEKPAKKNPSNETTVVLDEGDAGGELRIKTMRSSGFYVDRDFTDQLEKFVNESGHKIIKVIYHKGSAGQIRWIDVYYRIRIPKKEDKKKK